MDTDTQTNIDGNVLNCTSMTLPSDIIKRAGTTELSDGKIVARPDDVTLIRVEAATHIMPFRDVKDVKLLTLEGILAFVREEQRRTGEAVEWFVGEDRAEARLNYHCGDLQGWADSRAYFVMKNTPNWRAWLGANRQNLSQEQFCDFLEDNMGDIVKPAGADVLQLVSNFRAKTQVSYQSAYNTSDGRIKLIYDEEQTGAKREEMLPSVFEVELPVIEGAEEQTTYRMKARLRTRVNRDSRTLTFAYALIRPDIPAKNAIMDVASFLRERVDERDNVNEGMLIYTPDEMLERSFNPDND